MIDNRVVLLMSATALQLCIDGPLSVYRDMLLSTTPPDSGAAGDAPRADAHHEMDERPRRQFFMNRGEPCPLTPIRWEYAPPEEQVDRPEVDYARDLANDATMEEAFAALEAAKARREAGP